MLIIVFHKAVTVVFCYLVMFVFTSKDYSKVQKEKEQVKSLDRSNEGSKKRKKKGAAEMK